MYVALQLSEWIMNFAKTDVGMKDDPFAVLLFYQKHFINTCCSDLFDLITSTSSEKVFHSAGEVAVTKELNISVYGCGSIRNADA